MFPFLCFRNPGLRPKGLIEGVHIDFDSVLGRGSDAAVYNGVWNAPVAVKVLHDALIAPDVESRDVFIRKFVDECERMRELNHVNIVHFLGTTMTRTGAPALVTEKLASTLERHAERSELSMKELIRLFLDVTAGLAYIHSRGLVHRDLTTRNILLTAGTQPRAKITDVGVSKRLHGDNLEQLTRCPGTLVYMPPEAIGSQPTYDHRLDVFSFGVVAMATILRRGPSFDLMNIERYERLPDGSRRPISEIERRKDDFDAIPADHPLKPIIRRCLENDSIRRPTAVELHAELVRIGERLGFHDLENKVRVCLCLRSLDFSRLTLHCYLLRCFSWYVVC